MFDPAEPVYLDYNATAPILPDALERMNAAFRALPGNPSSPHRFGQAARAVLERDRERLAEALGFSRRDIVFTSGGSEGNNTILRWVAEVSGASHVISTPVEHPSVLRSVEWLARHGVLVSFLPVDGEGRADPGALTSLLRPETRLVSVMAANNETGVIQPLAEIGQALRESGAAESVLFHTDAVQALGRIPLALREWGLDACTVTAHKLGGPKGVGALACLDRKAPLPLIMGGAQERRRRAGTESAPLIEGFVAALDWVLPSRKDLSMRLIGLRERLLARLGEEEGLFVNGSRAPRLPNTLNLGFSGVSAASLLMALDLDGVAVSTGSACSSGAVEPSHVLRAMGLPAARIAESVRISLGYGTSEADVDRCAEVILHHVRRMRGRSKPRRASA